MKSYASPFSDPLWERLQRHSFDAIDASFPFSARLARDNGWSPGFAERVLDEYRRFCYLAMRAGHSVTPSDEVDQAWHQHLIYSFDYWKVFCPQVLESELHHGPTKGGDAERQKFNDWYARTLRSYEEIFHSPPPQDIWPEPSVRFGAAPHYRRVNVQEYRLVKRAAPGRGHLPIVLTIPLLCVVGCSAATESMALIVALAIVGGMIVLAFAVFRRPRAEGKSNGGDSPGGCGGNAGEMMDIRHPIDSADTRSSDAGADSSDASGCGGCGGCGD